MNKKIESFWDKDFQLHYDVCVAIGLIGGQNLEDALFDAESVRLYSKLPAQDKSDNYYLTRYEEYVKNKIENSLLIKDAFENRMKIKTILSSIIQNEFDKDPEEFYKSLQIAIKADYGEYLAPRSLSTVRKMQTFKVKNANAGIGLIKKEGKQEIEIVSLFNQSGIPGLGTKLFIMAISLGGKYLECFGPYLNDYYSSYNFEVIKEIPDVKMSNNKFQTLYRMKLNEKRNSTLTYT